jgi:esterase/lipase superfamily enzyme
LFGKGTGNVHPFESYKNYLIANGESPDSVVTNISYDLNADSMELLFTPLRNTSDEEHAMVIAAQANPEAQQYTKLTVAQTDGVTKKPEAIAAPKPVVTRSDEPDEEEMQQPVKRASKRAETPVVAQNNNLANVISDWGDED